MCRLSAYIGSPVVAAELVTRPNHSIMKQVRALAVLVEKCRRPLGSVMSRYLCSR
jgi:DUF917 family protein